MCGRWGVHRSALRVAEAEVAAAESRLDCAIEAAESAVGRLERAVQLWAEAQQAVAAAAAAAFGV